MAWRFVEFLMRIAIVNQPWSVYPPDHSADSIALVTQELARRLARSCEVTCYAKALPGRPQTETIEGVECRRVAPRLDALAKPLRLLDRWRLLPRTRPFYQSILYHLDYMRRVAWDLQRRAVDVVHVHNFAACAQVVKSYNPSVRTLLHMHCDWLCQLDRSLVEKRLRHVDGVITVSGFLAEKARRRFPDRAGDFQTLYNGVDTARFSPAPQPAVPRSSARRILYVGRLSPEKGVHILLQAFALVAREFPDAQLDLAGPESVLSREFVDPDRQDPILEKLSNYFDDRGSYVPWLRSIVGPDAADRVRFLGSLSHDQLPGYYRASEMLVVPSIFDEPFGLPIAEGLASGIPVIATRAGAFAEIIEDGKSGLLVDRDNVPQLADAIRGIFSDSSRADAIRVAARQRAESMFSWDDLAQRLKNRYEFIAGSQAASFQMRSAASIV